MLKVFAIVLLLTTNANAEDNHFTGMPKVGEATLSWLFWDAYDITLYAEHGRYNSEGAYALELEYQMDFTGKEIAERSAKEMRGQNSASQAQIAKWLPQMEGIFPDIKEGDKLLGIVSDDGLTFFQHNGKKTGSIEDPAFTKAFFDIWLGEKTSEPALRKKLLAGK